MHVLLISCLCLVIFITMGVSNGTFTTFLWNQKLKEELRKSMKSTTYPSPKMFEKETLDCHQLFIWLDHHQCSNRMNSLWPVGSLLILSWKIWKHFGNLMGTSCELDGNTLGTTPPPKLKRKKLSLPGQNQLIWLLKTSNQGYAMHMPCSYPLAIGSQKRKNLPTLILTSFRQFPLIRKLSKVQLLSEKWIFITKKKTKK